MIAGNGHLLLLGCLTPGIVIIEISRKVKHLILIQIQVTSISKPITMNGFVVNQQAERFIWVALIFNPINRAVCDNISQIAGIGNCLSILLNKLRVIIIPLPGYYSPTIETFRISV